jgi:2-polyprenyl-6-methoxyphenol hydroxylase-like FAD-dependent oxidoreductase
MPPVGESIGLAIEDGALIAHVLTRHTERTVTQLFADYETLRRPTIDSIYSSTVARWNMILKEDVGWFGNIFWDYMTIVYFMLLAWRQTDYFAADVANIELPA